MKALIFKALPFVVGIAVGWLILFPPEFLGPTLFVRIALAIPLALLAILVLVMFLISGALPAEMKLTPIDQCRITSEMVDLFNEYQNVGFELAGAPLSVGTTPPAVLVPLVDQESRMYGAIYRTGTDPPKTSFDFVSILDPYGGLTTGSMPEGSALPASPGAFYQVFPGSAIHVLRQKHVESLAYLESQGLRVKPASAEAFPHDFRNAIARMRAHFWSNPIWHTIVVLWRSTTGNTPHIGEIRQQSVAQATLRKAKDLPS